MEADVDQLLDGPRFRTLCVAIAEELDASVSTWSVGRAAGTAYAVLGNFPIPELEVATFSDQLQALRPDPVRRWTDPLQLFPALGAAVDSAMPWQPPLVEDAITALSAVREALRPIAEAILTAPAAAWWSSDLDQSAQWVVRPVRRGSTGPISSHSHAADMLATWSRNHAADERRSNEPHVPVADAAGGEWWSTPFNYGGAPGTAAFVPSSTRRLGKLGATALALQEDSYGDDEAVLQRLTPTRDLVVYEVHTVEDWADLVTRYPAPATWSRRKVWWESTGLEAEWCLPNYPAITRDYDGIHVSVQGYLCTAGRAISIDRGAAVLAGWGPDETYWLTDDITIAPEEECWVRGEDDDMHQWHRAS